jgi:hypothetical protein
MGTHRESAIAEKKIDKNFGKVVLNRNTVRGDLAAEADEEERNKICKRARIGVTKEKGKEKKKKEKEIKMEKEEEEEEEEDEWEMEKGKKKKR